MTKYSTVAIMGTGTMGPGMGAVMARAGYRVALYDTSAEALEGSALPSDCRRSESMVRTRRSTRVASATTARWRTRLPG